MSKENDRAWLTRNSQYSVVLIDRDTSYSSFVPQYRKTTIDNGSFVSVYGAEKAYANAVEQCRQHKAAMDLESENKDNRTETAAYLIADLAGFDWNKMSARQKKQMMQAVETTVCIVIYGS